jgi:peptide/nickel transport system substrate-binding protein
MKMSTRIAAVVASLVTVTALAACAPGGSGGAATGDAIVYNVATVGSVGSLDPARDASGGNNAQAAQSAVLEPLEVRPIDSEEFTPWLAESVALVDDVTIVYTIRQDVTFSDGTPLTADDVVWSIQHLIEPTTMTAAQLTAVASVQKSGDNEVTVTLTGPSPSARTSIANIVKIQQKANGERAGDALGTSGEFPIGTGPYVTTSFTPELVVTTRNPDYWGEAPLPEEVRFVAITGGDTAAQLAYRSGDLDLGIILDPKITDQYLQIRGTELYGKSSLVTDFFAFPVNTPPFDDVHIRRAVAHALDVPGLASASMDEYATLVQSMAPVPAFGSVPQADVDSFLESLPTYEFDLDKARAEIAESKYADDFTSFTIYYANEMVFSQLAALNIKENLGTLGIDVQLDSMPVTEYLGSAFAGHPNLPGAYLNSFSSTDLSGLALTSTPGPNNFAGWVPENAQELGSALNDLDTQWAAAKEIIQKQAEELPYIPMFQPPVTFVSSEAYGFDRDISIFDFSNGQFLHLLKLRG